MGDFNIPLNKCSQPTLNLIFVLNEFNLSNRVTVPTVTSGNVLDFVIFDIDEQVSVKVKPSQSDHMYVFFDFQVETKATSRVDNYGYKWRKVGEQDFQENFATNLTNMMDYYCPQSKDTTKEIVNESFEILYESLDYTRNCLAS